MAPDSSLKLSGPQVRCPLYQMQKAQLRKDRKQSGSNNSVVLAEGIVVEDESPGPTQYRAKSTKLLYTLPRKDSSAEMLWILWTKSTCMHLQQDVLWVLHHCVSYLLSFEKPSRNRNLRDKPFANIANLWVIGLDRGLLNTLA